MSINVFGVMLTGIGRRYGMEMDVEKTKVMRITSLKRLKYYPSRKWHMIS
jgi:hypothetical protein